jgi:hypothetical protein
VTQAYDLFLSYARADQDHGDDDAREEDGRENSKFVTRLASEMERAFRSATGQPLRIFLDVQEIKTAHMWEQRIERALGQSSLMIAILAPSYFTSIWCTREWGRFEERERRLRREGKLHPSEALIFPVLYQSLDEVLDREARRRVTAAGKRQYRDLRQVEPGSAAFRMEVRALIHDVVQALLRLQELEVPTPDEVAEETRRQARRPGADRPPFPPTAIRSQRVRTRIGEEELFVEQLSQADRAVIVGLTNVRLQGFLDEALRRKRAARGDGAFWSTIEVVFASEPVLGLVHDELNHEFLDRDEATRFRLQQAERGRESVASFLLRANRPNQWKLYEYGNLPPFVGAMMEMPDGSRLIQVATLRPAWGVADYLFLEFFEMAGEVAYYQGAFDQIRLRSRTIEEVLLIGVPDPEGRGFYCRAPLPRRYALQEGRDSREWVPAVIVCTYYDHPAGAQPILQFRTRRNADRELGRLSHVSGYVYQRDCEDSLARRGGEFLLPGAAARTAAQRKLREVLYVAGEPELVGELRYHSSTTQSFYFYLFAAALPYAHRLPPEGNLDHWTLPELVRLREHQVLTHAQWLLEHGSEALQPELAFRATGLNLIVHGHGDLGRRFVDHVADDERGATTITDLAETVQRLRLATAPQRPLPDEERLVHGLSGLQFREFFSWLLPFYASIGVEGAEQALSGVRGDGEAARALGQLTELYRDEAVMRRLSLRE